MVTKSGAKNWVFLYRWKTSTAPGAGKLREMGLGSVLGVSLSAAREAAAAARAQVAARIDPISAKRVEHGVPSFGELADQHVLTKTQSGNIDKSIALEKAETAQKVRGHLEAVLDAAKARGFRSGENPARWKGHLDHLLARQGRALRGHHDAMDYKALPAFFTKICEKKGAGAQALRFTILTAARSGETFGATWSEIDWENSVWTVPAMRMKERREHRVPLSDEAIQILKDRRGRAHPQRQR